MMKKVLLLLAVFLPSGMTLAQPQCPMTAHIDTRATVTMTTPDGQVSAVVDSTTLGAYGTYRLHATVDDDTLSLPFTLTEDVLSVDVQLRIVNNYFDPRLSVDLDVTRHLIPPDSIKIVSFENVTEGDFPGPVFKVYNGSEDTLYGRFMPNYLWGWLEVLKDGIPLGKLIGMIDVNFVEGSPFIPKSFKYATVGSFGRRVYAGIDYRFVLECYTPYRSTLAHESSTYRWFTHVKSWYQLSYDFRIEPEE